MTNRQRIDILEQQGHLEKEQWVDLLATWEEPDRAYAAERAVQIAEERFGKGIFVRGLIEFSNYCKNNCYYCGIRCGNRKVERYRLTQNEILACCQTGYALGFRTFVLQSGEDPQNTDHKMVRMIAAIKEAFPDCALTLSLGERDRASYQAFRDAGADRYLLRHETADPVHYAQLHPRSMRLSDRMQCLYDLREIGFQTGCGFMVGSPGQTPEQLAEDLLFIGRFQPHMVGIGPFLPHTDTPLRGEPAGSLQLTLFLLSLVRILCKDALLPATTALGTLHPNGRELGIQSGANVVMPNLSPVAVRGKYLLYDNKICTGDEAAECRCCMERRMERIGYRLVTGRGDYQPSVKTSRSPACARMK